LGIVGGIKGGLLGGQLGELKFKIQKNSGGQFYWTAHRTTGNREAIAVSEPYTAKHNCEHSIKLLQQYAAQSYIEDLTA
jgi:uncharacterized protein YegP (UPF0339 family)